MSDKFEEIVDNLKQPSHWIRLPFMVAYAFVLYLIFVPAIIVIMVAQLLFALITGESNRNLRGLGSVVQQYVGQIISYILYNSEERPFPFSDFPSEDLSVVEQTVTSNPKADTTEEKEKPKKAKKAAVKPKSGKVTEPDTKSSEKTAVKKSQAKKKAPAKKKKPVTQETETPPVTPTEEQ